MSAELSVLHRIERDGPRPGGREYLGDLGVPAQRKLVRAGTVSATAQPDAILLGRRTLDGRSGGPIKPRH